MLVCANIFASGFEVTRAIWRNTRHRLPCGINISELSLTVRGFWRFAANRDSRALSRCRDNGFWIFSCIFSIKKINIHKKRYVLRQQTQGFREARSGLRLFGGDIVWNTYSTRHSQFMATVLGVFESSEDTHP